MARTEGDRCRVALPARPPHRDPSGTRNLSLPIVEYTPSRPSSPDRWGGTRPTGGMVDRVRPAQDSQLRVCRPGSQPPPALHNRMCKVRKSWSLLVVGSSSWSNGGADLGVWMPAKAKWAQLADNIRERIESGELAPGTSCRRPRSSNWSTACRPRSCGKRSWSFRCRAGSRESTVSGCLSPSGRRAHSCVRDWRGVCEWTAAVTSLCWPRGSVRAKATPASSSGTASRCGAGGSGHGAAGVGRDHHRWHGADGPHHLACVGTRHRRDRHQFCQAREVGRVGRVERDPVNVGD